MPFTPELPPEIRRRLLARLVALSRYKDVAEGDPLGTVLGVNGDEYASHQQKLKEMVDGYYFDANGEVLDERADQLPEEFERRRGPRSARGGGIFLTRSDASGEETYDPGSILAGRSGAPSLSYLNTSTITFGVGVYTVSLNEFICTATGVVGRAPAGAVDTLVGAAGTIYDVGSVLPMTGGYDREEDPEYRARCRAWARSLTRTTPDAIVATAMNFSDEDGAAVRFSTPVLWEDPEHLGYCELIVDDGFGFVGYYDAAVDTTGVFPTITGSVRHQIIFDMPAKTPPMLWINGAGPFQLPHPDFMVIEERGLCIIREDPQFITPVGTWVMGGHQVYKRFIANLQAHVEIMCRAGGNRVRVVVPDPQEIFVTANVTVTEGSDIDIIFDRVKKGIVSYMSKLPPGQPLLFFRLGADLSTIPGVHNIKFDQGDVYAANPRTKLIIYYSSITLR